MQISKGTLDALREGQIWGPIQDSLRSVNCEHTDRYIEGAGILVSDSNSSPEMRFQFRYHFVQGDAGSTSDIEHKVCIRPRSTT